MENLYVIFWIVIQCNILNNINMNHLIGNLFVSYYTYTYTHTHIV